MKKALCIQDRNQFIAALTSQSEEIFQARLVDRAECEKPDCGLVHVIPYGTFFSFDIQTGIAGVLTYNRPTKAQGGDGEKLLMGNASVGFGGHVDDEELLEFQSKEGEGDDTVYHMTAKDIVSSAIKTLNKELIEELGEDFFNLLQEVAGDVQLDVINEQNPNAVGLLHLGIGAYFPVSAKDLDRLYEATKAQPNEVIDLRVMKLNVGTALTSFDSSVASRYIIDTLAEEHKFENWTKVMLEGIYLMIVNLFRSRIDYQSLFRAFAIAEDQLRKRQAEQAEVEKLKAEEVAGDEAQQSLPVCTGEPENVTDIASTDATPSSTEPA